MQDLILFPFSGNAREAVSVVEAINSIEPTWNLLGFVDDSVEVQGRDYCGYRVLGDREMLRKHASARVLAVPGRPENFRARDRIIDSLGLPPEHFVTLVHPRASVGFQCRLGFNTLLMAGVVLTAGVSVGNHCVILPNTVIAHESVIGDYCLLGSNISVSGGVKIEPKCYIGTGSSIIQEVTIGSETLVGIGSVVIRPVAPGSKVAGSPAKYLS